MKIVADSNIPYVRQCFSCMGEVEALAGDAITGESISGADILLIRSVTKVNEELLKGSGVRFVGTATIGFEHVDREYLERQGIGFASAPGSNANSVAEYVVAGLLLLGERHNVKLEGSSIGIIGVGNVGSRVEQKSRELGMEVLLNDPPLERKTGDKKYLPLKEVLRCDFVTIHTPLTFAGQDKTYHLADEEFFGLLKKNCFFINTSRGAVVDSPALKSVVTAGKLGGVILDVWENEPEIDTELLKIVDVGTPHIAGYSLDGKVRGMVMLYDAVCDYFGLEKRFYEADFLPAVENSKITVDCAGLDEQPALRDAVFQGYNIKWDDEMLRAIAEMKAEERGNYFRRLRKEYPVRREFGNMEVLCRDCPVEVAEKLGGIGFKVQSGK